MGKVVVQFKAQNWGDLEALAYGTRSEPARSVAAEALVDTGATKLYFQSTIVRQLGLRHIAQLSTRTMSDRSEQRRVFSPVDLEVQGRSGRYDVVEISDTLPNIIGQIPLEDLDWVVDPRGQRLIANPEHRHGELADEFCSASFQLASEKVRKLEACATFNHMCSITLSPNAEHLISVAPSIRRAKS